MNSVARTLYFPVMIAAAVILSRRWPAPMRRASRCLAAANALALLCIIATGWAHHPELVAEIHRWFPHVLIIVDWIAIPLAIGVTLAHPRGHPIATAARAMGLLMILGVIFLASITGYAGPLHGPIDAMSVRRFQVLHYWLWPSLASAHVSWWYFRRTVTDPALDRAARANRGCCPIAAGHQP
jgi:hypothetical protein